MAGFQGYSTSEATGPMPQGNLARSGANAPSGVAGATPSNGVPPSLQNLWNLEQPAISGILGSGQQQQQDLLNQYLNQMQMNQLSGGLQQQEAGFQQQGNLLSGQSLGIQQGALQRQMGLLPQQYGLQTQGFDLSQAQQQANAANQMTDLNNQLSASGSFTNPGSTDQRNRINQNLQFGLQQLGLQRQGAQLNFAEQQAAQKDASAELGIQSKRLGISEQEISTRLDNALQQLGISGQVDKNQVLQAINQVRQGEATQLAPILGDLANASGMPILAGG